MPTKCTVAGITLLLLLTTLASPLLQAGQNESGPQIAFPAMIWVADFTVSVDHIKMHEGPLEEIGKGPILSHLKRLESHIPLITRYSTPQELTTSVVNTLADSLTAALQDAALPARRLPAGQAVPASGWLVSGRFDQLNDGDTAKSAIIGFGQGAPKVEVSGMVNNLPLDQNSQPLLVFGEDSHKSVKSRLPGGALGEIVMHTPYMMAAKFVLDSHATEDDVKALGKAIAKEIVHMMASKQLLRSGTSN